MFWGLTPALDLQEEYKSNGHVESDELNILLIGGSDCRHVLKTIARKYRHDKIKLNFYLIDGCVEIIAKQLLLLYISFQSTEVLGDVQKTRTFMELYGNAVVRPYVGKYLNQTATELIKMVTNYDYLKQIMPYVDVEIKYKERDYMENLIKFWCSADDFDICDSWDRRVRKSLGARYDAKTGAFDWDLHMRFHPMGGTQVCSQEYKSFRNDGIAFVWLESEVSKPNRSLVCATIPNGVTFVHYGYLGDIQTGPFVAYGLECEDDEFLKTSNGTNKFRATDVTERNLRQIFHEIVNESKYEHTTTNDYLMGSIRIQEEKPIIDIRAENKVYRAKSPKCVCIEDVHIKFLSLAALQQMNYKECYKEFFNIIYFGSTYIKYLCEDFINNITAKKALLIIENQRFILSYRDKELKEFGETINTKMEKINAFAIPVDVLKDNYFQFILNA